MILTDDLDAWKQYPQHHNWFNKLWLSEQLNYVCGPGGVPVVVPNTYVVRPVYNLRGMGISAQLMHLEPSNYTSVLPGYFWCEQFHGAQYSVDYTWRDNRWQQLNAMQGVNHPEQLWKFTRWTKTNKPITPPTICNVLQDCRYINIEYIEDKAIEVHLRVSPDPEQYSELIPVWANTEIQVSEDYTWIPHLDDGNGLLPEARLGFYAR